MFYTPFVYERHEAVFNSRLHTIRHPEGKQREDVRHCSGQDVGSL